jgi:FkbM family methyltransferase
MQTPAGLSGGARGLVFDLRYNRATSAQVNPMPLRRYTYYLSSIFTLLAGFRNPLQIIQTFLVGNRRPGLIVQLRTSNLKFMVRGKMDIWSLKETLLDRFYERYGFVIREGWTVVDIGGGIGDYSIYAATSHANVRVLAFEPFPDSYRLLQENIKINQISNIESFSQAVSSRDGMMEFSSPSSDPLSIQTTSNPTDIAGVSTSTRAVSLASIPARYNVERIDLLKLDCEGAEYDILIGSDPAVLEKIDRIVMEYHDGITGFTHTDLVNFLTEHGYQVNTWKNFAHDHIGYLRAHRTGAAAG